MSRAERPLQFSSPPVEQDSWNKGSGDDSTRIQAE